MFYYNDTARLGHEINFRTCNAMQKQLIQIHEQHVALRVITPEYLATNYNEERNKNIRH